MNRLYSALLTGAIALSPLVAAAQSKLQKADPPQGVVSNAQPWLTHQEWLCIPKTNLNANQFVRDMAGRINTIAQSGWEPVAFNQVAIAGETCFLATFKAPKQK